MITSLRKKLKNTYRSLDIFCEALLRFVFGQSAFTLLPIAVIAIIRLVIGEKNGYTTFLNEISFATVVFYGLTLTQTLELKKLQGDLHSFRVKLLIQTFILHLIVAVVSLSMVVLNSNGIALNLPLLETIQLWLFVFSIWWLFLTYYTRIKLEKRKNFLDATVSSKEFYNYFDQSLISAKENLSYILFACQRKDDIQTNIDNAVYDSSEHFINEMEDDFDSKISDIEKILSEIKSVRKK